MTWQRKVALLLILIGVLVVVAACADPRPILRLPAPTPIGREVGPTPTLVPALAAAAGEEVAEAPAGGGEALPTPPARPVAAEGEAIYTQNCVACHGQDGTGVVQGAPDFTDPTFWRERPLAELFLTVTNGKGAMPAWKGTLDEQQRWNVLMYEYDHAVSPEVLARGKEIFAQNCAACHGEDGTGVVQGTPDFTDPAYMATVSMAEQFEVVTNGRGAMPPWGNQLSEDDRWAVLTYIRTFAYDSTRQP